RPPIETLTLEQLVADADALRAHLGLERVAVLGHSYGGCVALQHALRYPQRLSHLLPVGTTAAWDYTHEIIAELQRTATSPEVLTAFLDVAGATWSSPAARSSLPPPSASIRSMRAAGSVSSARRCESRSVRPQPRANGGLQHRVAAQRDR